MAKPASVSAALDGSDDGVEGAEASSNDSGGGIGVRVSEPVPEGKSNTDENAMEIDSSTPPHSNQPEAAAEQAATPSTAPATSSKLNLDDLRNVEPFAPTPKFGQAGMLNDLSSSLPFESRPSAHPPVATDSDSSDGDKRIPGLSTPQPLELPNVPRAPKVPKTLTPTAWELYLGNVQAYLSEWVAFNDRMLTHFDHRQRDTKVA
jgi:hypothetical protein